MRVNLFRPLSETLSETLPTTVPKEFPTKFPTKCSIECPTKAARRTEAGNFLMVALFTVGLIAALVIGCLSLVGSQNVATARSQAWNQCIPVIEAGIEEAMAHLNNRFDTNLTSDNWVLQNGLYTQKRSIGDGYYVVGISMTNFLKPVILCTG